MALLHADPLGGAHSVRPPAPQAPREEPAHWRLKLSVRLRGPQLNGTIVRPTAMTDSDAAAKVTRWLRWFERRSDHLVGEAEIRGITLEELQAMFSIGADSPMYDCFRVEAPQLHRLERAVNVKIDLEQFEYFVEADAEI
jgi:hypothetical protein